MIPSVTHNKYKAVQHKLTLHAWIYNFLIKLYVRNILSRYTSVRAISAKSVQSIHVICIL